MVNYLKGTREIRTSSFFSYRGPLGVSIANSAPHFYSGPRYSPLVPSWYLVKDYQQGKIGQEQYTKEYMIQLRSLDPRKVYEDLFKIYNENPVLLCWEPAGDFCHRRIVGEWLEAELGVAVSIG
jgi:hypothetical protein